MAAAFDRERLVALLKRDALRTGTFTLASGRTSHYYVDGRKVTQLWLSAQVRGKDIRPGENARQLPDIVISFFDENRATLGEASLGPWRGTFGWRGESKLIAVPSKTREAILRIGLLGATGEISFDAIELRPVRK